jgi:tryptophan-rich sensory protein
MTTESHSPRRWPVLVGLLLLTLGIGFVGSLVTLPQIPTWYATLNKPSFTPPNGVFGPVWTLLYVMMAVAAWRVWCRAVPGPERRSALIAFFVQLALNAIWSPVFFGLNAPASGLVVIVALVGALATTLVLFWRLDRPAGLLLVPYLAWVGFATALNGAIVVLN